MFVPNLPFAALKAPLRWSSDWGKLGVVLQANLPKGNLNRCSRPFAPAKRYNPNTFHLFWLRQFYEAFRLIPDWPGPRNDNAQHWLNEWLGAVIVATSLDLSKRL